MSWSDTIDTTRQDLRTLNALIPDTARAFGGLGKAVKEGGTLDFKTKEFWHSDRGGDRCEPCIALHMEALIRAGTTREEVGDVLAMSIQMGGGPAMMYAAKALACMMRCNRSSPVPETSPLSYGGLMLD